MNLVRNPVCFRVMKCGTITLVNTVLLYSFFRAAVLASCALLLGACAAHRHPQRPLRAPEPRPESIVAYYTYDGQVEMVADELIETRPGYTVRRVALLTGLAEPDIPFDIEIEYFDPVAAPERRPSILFLPIFDETQLISNFFARYFAHEGFPVAVVYTGEEHSTFDDFDTIEPSLRSMVARQRLALDWLLHQPGNDPERVGAMGISLGGIKAALVKGIDERIGPAVLGLAGGDIPYIAAHSVDGTIRRLREEHLTETGVTIGQAEAELRKAVRTDPALLAPYVSPDDVLMFIARYDDHVPYAAQKLLWEKVGKPRAYVLVSGHISSFLHIAAVRRRALRFFVDEFNRPDRE